MVSDDVDDDDVLVVVDRVLCCANTNDDGGAAADNNNDGRSLVLVSDLVRIGCFDTAVFHILFGTARLDLASR